MKTVSFRVSRQALIHCAIKRSDYYIGKGLVVFSNMIRRKFKENGIKVGRIELDSDFIYNELEIRVEIIKAPLNFYEESNLLKNTLNTLLLEDFSDKQKDLNLP